MYDPKFSVKQMYSNYGSSFKSNTKTSNANKQAADSMRSAGVSGLGSRPTFNFNRDDDSSGADNNPNRDAMETRSTVDKLYNKAVTLLRNFGASEPEDVIVDGKAVYKGPAFRGYDPTTRIGDFGGEYGKKQYLFGMPKLGEVTPRSPTSPTLPPAVDNPVLNMFDVRRGFTRDPNQLIPPVLPESPANMDPMTRVLSQAMIPPSDFLTTAEYTVSEGESLLTVLDTLNAGKPNSQKVTLEELGELNNIPDAVADPFGKIEKGQVIKVPVKKQTAVGDLRDRIEAERSIERFAIEYERLPEKEKQKIQDRYRLLEQAQPASFMDAETKAMLDETTPVKASMGTPSSIINIDPVAKTISDYISKMFGNSKDTAKPFTISTNEIKTFAKEMFDPVQAAAFVATFEAETGGGKSLVEKGYSKKRAIEVFVNANKREDGTLSEKMKDRKRRIEKSKNSEEIFNIVYGDRMGNTQPGDGFKYRGRGPIMLTGKNNYKEIGDAIGVDLVNNPDLLITDPSVSLRATTAYLQSKNFQSVNSATTLANVVGHSNPQGKEGIRRWNNANKFYKEMYGKPMPTLIPKQRPAGLMEKYTIPRPQIRPENS